MADTIIITTEGIIMGITKGEEDIETKVITKEITTTVITEAVTATIVSNAMIVINEMTVIAMIIVIETERESIINKILGAEVAAVMAETEIKNPEIVIVIKRKTITITETAMITECISDMAMTESTKRTEDSETNVTKVKAVRPEPMNPGRRDKGLAENHGLACNHYNPKKAFKKTLAIFNKCEDKGKKRTNLNTIVIKLMIKMLNKVRNFVRKSLLPKKKLIKTLLTDYNNL